MMAFYQLLAFSSVAIIVLTVVMCRKSGRLDPLLGISFLYFWSLYGGWFLVHDLSGGESVMHYQYLFDKMFQIGLDEAYFRSLVLYSVFIVFVQLSFLVVVRPYRRQNEQDESCSFITISHGRVILISGIAALLSFCIMRGQLAAAGSMGVSGYLFTRGVFGNEQAAFFAIHQELNRIAIVPAAIGCAVLMGGDDATRIRGCHSLLALIGYMAVLGGMFLFCIKLGNKNELLFGLIAGSMFYLANTRKPKLLLLSFLGSIALGGIAMINYVRALAVTEVGRGLTLESMVLSLRDLFVNNEAFGAHFSMYGALSFELPLTWGSSLLALVESVVPRALWAGRAEDIYYHYADGCAVQMNQGYSIHHATAWYLNFGTIGVLIGAIILGCIWAGLINMSRTQFRERSNLVRVFCFIGCSTFTAYIASLVRAGPEAYKGLILEAFIFPVVVLCSAIVEPKKQSAVID